MKVSGSWLNVRGHWLQTVLTAASLTTTTLISTIGWDGTAQAQTAPYCQTSAETIAQKNQLRQVALQSDRGAQNRYKDFLKEQADKLRQCRSQSWLQTQAIWLRLYPCDARPGALEAILDQIVDKGYNQVYIEVFGNGQVLLPQSSNRTAWPSLIRTPGYADRDLLAEAIAKGRERGLKVYAWMFTMNFGYSYAQRPGSENVLAHNGNDQTSLTFRAATDTGTDVGGVGSDEVFIDPYSLQARQDYTLLVQSIVQRQPDGVLFDYVRYPRGSGSASVVSRVKDLWIYGTASQQALYERALNTSGQDLIRRFLAQGYVTTTDIVGLKQLYPQEGGPLWQGLTPLMGDKITPQQAQSYFQAELWRLAIAHAIQGVLDFLSTALLPVQRQGVTAGAVFFPDGNQAIGQGYDSRLQPWERFPTNVEWHPMAYGSCGTTSCIIAQIQRVLSMAPPNAQVMPVLVGNWGQVLNGRPTLEAQMQAIHQDMPQITSISHFAYSWQNLDSDRDRKFCQLQ
jgi:hypothetical protein